MPEEVLTAGTVSWAVRTVPSVVGDGRWRAQLVAAVRTELERRLPRDPSLATFSWGGPLFSVHVQRESGHWRPGAAIHLAFREERPLRRAAPHGQTAAPFVSRALPDDQVARLGERLVGLDRVGSEMLLRLRCAWDGGLQAWSEQTGTPLVPALTAPLEERAPLFVLAGDPGVGKSALAQAVADRYCRETEAPGHLLWIGTAARGNGLVGDFGNQVRAAFEAAQELAAQGPCFLVIDEADALAMRRSERHAHQEDRAGTATLLQCLDALRGGQRIAVILTTNLLSTVDAAVLRRSATYELGRPDPKARQLLLARWLPEVKPRTLARAVRTASGMTPADIERALSRACLEAVDEGVPLTPERVIRHLQRHERTGSV